MQFRDNLEIPGGQYLTTDQNRGWTGYCSADDKCLNLHEKWYLKENMVGTTIAKGQIPDIRWTYTKVIINLREAFNNKIYIMSMGMNTKFKVDSDFSNA